MFESRVRLLIRPKKARHSDGACAITFADKDLITTDVISSFDVFAALISFETCFELNTCHLIWHCIEERKTSLSSRHIKFEQWQPKTFKPNRTTQLLDAWLACWLLACNRTFEMKFEIQVWLLIIMRDSSASKLLQNADAFLSFEHFLIKCSLYYYYTSSIIMESLRDSSSSKPSCWLIAALHESVDALFITCSICTNEHSYTHNNSTKHKEPWKFFLLSSCSASSSTDFLL